MPLIFDVLFGFLPLIYLFPLAFMGTLFFFVSGELFFLHGLGGAIGIAGLIWGFLYRYGYKQKQEPPFILLLCLAIGCISLLSFVLLLHMRAHSFGFAGATMRTAFWQFIELGPFIVGIRFLVTLTNRKYKMPKQEIDQGAVPEESTTRTPHE